MCGFLDEIFMCAMQPRPRRSWALPDYFTGRGYDLVRTIQTCGRAQLRLGRGCNPQIFSLSTSGAFKSKKYKVMRQGQSKAWAMVAYQPKLNPSKPQA